MFYNPLGFSLDHIFYPEITTSITHCKCSFFICTDYDFCLYRWHANRLYHTCTYSRLTEDGLSGSKHVEGIVNIEILV